jgi:serine/threonine-protein kinase RsbW
MESDEPQFHLAIDSRFENIDLVQVVLNESMEALGVEEDARHWIELAVREAVANAIKHGNGQDPQKCVQIDARLDAAVLVIQIRDQGQGFDPEQLEDPLEPENLLKPNGRGIFYMRSFMDSIEYGVHPDGGTVVTLRKSIARPKGERATNHEEESKA